MTLKPRLKATNERERNRALKRRATDKKHVHFEDIATRLDKNDVQPLTPSAATNKNVFFESYTDSPEFTYIDNPVVYMEEELLPEEQEPSPTQQMPPRASSPRRHPLSQVSYPESSSPNEDTRRVMPAARPTSEYSVHDSQRVTVAETRSTVLGAMARSPILIDDDEEDEDDEEPEDDTFEFLLR